MSRDKLQAGSESFKVWTTGPAAGLLTFESKTQKFTVTGGCVYLQVCYLDAGYGLIDVQLQDQSGRKTKPDRFLGLTMANSGALVRARMRFTGLPARDTGGISFSVAISKSDKPLAVESAILQDAPFEDPNFTYANLKSIGLQYYAHVKPGFSWANLKHLPTGDDTIAFPAGEGFVLSFDLFIVPDILGDFAGNVTGKRRPARKHIADGVMDLIRAAGFEQVAARPLLEGAEEEADFFR